MARIQHAVHQVGEHLFVFKSENKQRKNGEEKRENSALTEVEVQTYLLQQFLFFSLLRSKAAYVLEVQKVRVPQWIKLVPLRDPVFSEYPSSKKAPVFTALLTKSIFLPHIADGLFHLVMTVPTH